MAAYRNLLAPGRINRLELRNRIFMTPMGSNLAEEDGYCGPRLAAYYAARARGGAALVTMGSVSIGYPEGASNFRHEAISDDRYIPGLTSVADAIHAHGAKVCVQLHHAGLTAMNDMLDGRSLACPSVPQAAKTDGDFAEVMLEEEAEKFFEPYSAMGEVAYEPLSPDRMARLVDMYAHAAERAVRAGIDAVEIHAGHGYVISSFLSPQANRRTDAYGGSVENRSRLLMEVIQGIRSAVGPGYPVWARIDSEEFYLEDGIKLEDAKVTALLAQEAGLDAIHVSAHGDANRGITYSTGHATHMPQGFVSNAAAIKSVVDIPVIVPGRIEPSDADRLIAAGRFDFLTMGRKLLADPDLPRKLQSGDERDVRPCIYCYTCISNIFHGSHIVCAVNPDTAYELDRASNIRPAEHEKHIVVVGGGPAGLECTRLLAEAGHRVTLLERSDQLGGTARIAAIAYEPNEPFVEWLTRQVAGSPRVSVQMNCEATPEAIAAMNPDHVVVAVGAKRTMPHIEGSHRDFVFDGDQMRGLLLGEGVAGLGWLANSLLRVAGYLRLMNRASWVRALSRIWMPVGKHVVIIGGELVGVELAEFLAHRGRSVTILEESANLGRGIQLVRRFRALEDLRGLGVKWHLDVTNVSIGERQVTFECGGERASSSADMVVVAKGAQSNSSLATALRNQRFDVFEMGDSTGVGYLNKAIGDASRVARQIG